MYEDIKVVFKQVPDRTGVNMFVFFESSRGRVSMLKDMKTLEFETIEMGAAQTPIYLPPDIFNAMKETILREFRGQNSTFVEGKLDATEKHLQDMRTLLKLK